MRMLQRWSLSVLNKNCCLYSMSERSKSVRQPKGSDMEYFMTCSGTGFIKNNNNNNKINGSALSFKTMDHHIYYLILIHILFSRV